MNCPYCRFDPDAHDAKVKAAYDEAIAGFQADMRTALAQCEADTQKSIAVVLPAIVEACAKFVESIEDQDGCGAEMVGGLRSGKWEQYFDLARAKQQIKEQL